MVENVARTIEILRKNTRSMDDLDFLYSQLSQLSDLRQYIFDLPLPKKLSLLSAFQVESYPDGSLVFRKGDPSSKLYLILSGKLDMFDEEGKTSIHIATLPAGKMIGERGLVRKTERMLTARANSACSLLTLDQTSFHSLLEDAVYHRMEEKLRFIDRYLPCARAMASAPKERLAYAFDMRYFHRGQRLLAQGEVAAAIYFVSYGECTVTETYHRSTKNVVKLSPGCWTGEDCVLCGVPSLYDVLVSSEFAWLYSLSKEHAGKLLAEATVEVMKQQSVLKRKNRVKLAKKVVELRAGTGEGGEGGEGGEMFHLASPVAKRMLVKTSSSLRRAKRSLFLRGGKTKNVIFEGRTERCNSRRTQ